MIGLSRRDRPLPSPVTGGEVVAETFEVCAQLGGHQVVGEVSLTAVAGEVLALVGPNGAGKSTLLAVLAADQTPTGGDVELHGRPLSSWGAPDLALRRAMLPQSASLAFPFRVSEVVAMGRAPWAGTAREAEDDRIIAEVMSACEVTEFAERPFPALSGGERARVALARVLAQDTGLLLLDEPTAALDLRHQELVLRLCRERAAQGVAVVVVLHDLGLAAAHCDRVAILHQGRLEACGGPVEVFDEELLTRVYRQPVEVLRHPHTEDLIVLPRRRP